MENIYQVIVKSLKFNLWNIDLGLINPFLAKFPAETLNLEVLDYISKECNDKQIIEPEWTILSGRIQTFMIHQQITREYLENGVVTGDLDPKIISFSECTEIMKDNLVPKYYNFVMKNAQYFDDLAEKYKFRDFNFDLLGISTLKKSYLCHFSFGKSNKLKIIETPTYMYLRIAIFLHFPWESPDDLIIDGVNYLTPLLNTFHSLSNGIYSHASPTMFNAGRINHQMSSCFLLDTSDNSDSIIHGWKCKALISKNCGGLGVGMYQLRHSEVGQNGVTRGVVSWAKVDNAIVIAYDQGGKRQGSEAVYLRDCHIDIIEFIELNDIGPDENRAKDLFTAIMVSDLFMRRVEENGDWILLCPAIAKKDLKGKNIMDTFGEEFEELYLYLEANGLYKKKVSARSIFVHIMNMQLKKGMPFILFIDSCNRKSNQLTYTDSTLSKTTSLSGMIHTSNLCTEILEITNDKEIASCNLAAVALNKCVKKVKNESKIKYAMDWDILDNSVRQLVRNLDNVIDRNKYPEQIPEILYANNLRRPIGIGVHGQADLFALLDIPWVNKRGDGPSTLATVYNSHIYETMYYAALDESCNLAIERGAYPSFKGSPTSFGYLQQDLWEKFKPKVSNINKVEDDTTVINRYSEEQWNSLRQKIMANGLRHSLLLALMPTASSAHILGNNECFEAFHGMIYAKSILSGQFTIVNRYMVKDLKEIGLWGGEAVKSIVSSNGSLANFNPDANKETLERLTFLKRKYLTNFEIPQVKVMAPLAIDRGKWICQTQSMNCFLQNPNFEQIYKWLHYLWRNGAKTGIYYLRQPAKVNPVGFALASLSKKEEEKKEGNVVAECVSCST